MTAASNPDWEFLTAEEKHIILLEEMIKNQKVDPNYICELIDQYPNDMELGKALREYYIMERKKRK